MSFHNPSPLFLPIWKKRLPFRLAGMLLAILVGVAGLSGLGAARMHADADVVQPHTDWPLFRLRQGAFRHVPLRVAVTVIQPARDPDYSANRRAMAESRTALSTREIPVSDGLGYAVLYSAPATLVLNGDKKTFEKKAFYDSAGNTRAVALAYAKGYPGRTALYAYPSGKLKTVTFSLSPQDRFVFDAEGNLCERPDGEAIADNRSGADWGLLARMSDNEDANGEGTDEDNIQRPWRRLAYERKVARVTRKILEANHIRQNIPALVADQKGIKGVNAYALLQRGEIYIGKPLLRYVENDDELAGVIGHELAHILLRHHDEESGAGVQVAIGGHKFQDQQEVRFDWSQRQEIEADARGIRLAMRAGYDPEGQYRLLQKIAGDANPDNPGHITHPQTTLRLKILKREIAALRKEMEATTPTAEVVFFDASGKIRVGSWDEATARLEISRYPHLASSVREDIRAFPAVDPDSHRKSALPDRQVRYFTYLEEYAELMRGTGRETRGYAVSFAGARAFPAYQPDGKLNSLTVCNRTEFPRVCYTAAVPDGPLQGTALEISGQVALFFNPQGQWLGYRQNDRRYDVQRRLMGVFTADADPGKPNMGKEE